MLPRLARVLACAACPCSLVHSSGAAPGSVASRPGTCSSQVSGGSSSMMARDSRAEARACLGGVCAVVTISCSCQCCAACSPGPKQAEASTQATAACTCLCQRACHTQQGC